MGCLTALSLTGLDNMGKHHDQGLLPRVIHHQNTATEHSNSILLNINIRQNILMSGTRQQEGTAPLSTRAGKTDRGG